MRKLYLLILLILTHTICFSQKGITNYWEIEADTSEAKINFIKNYNFRHPNQQQQEVIRNYYGYQRNALSTFTNNKYKSYPNIQEYTKYPLASFFAVDAYEHTNETYKLAQEIFRPVLDSIFSNAKNDSVFHAEILVVGYTNIEPSNNDFAKELISTKLNKPVITESEYKNAISFLRAKTIGKLIQDLLEKNNTEFKNYNNVLVDIIMIGRGDNLPELNRKYDAFDDKRRIAKVYWRLL